MTTRMTVSAFFLVFGIAAFINLTYFNSIGDWLVSVYREESLLAIEMVKLQAALMSICGFAYLLISYSDNLHTKARQNPLVIELSKNTAMGSWDGKKDVMIGAPFSDDKDLVSNSELLIKAINQIIDTYRNQKGGSKAGLFIALRPLLSEGKELSEGDTVLLSEVIAKSSAKSGSVFVR